MDQTSIRQFPNRSTLQRIHTLRESLIDLSVAIDDVRAELAWPDADPALVAEHDRLAALLEQTRRELAGLLGRAA
jgi:hypothetical protein